MVKINGIQKFPELPYEFILDGTEEFKKCLIELDNLSQVTPFDDYSNIDIVINGINYAFTLESDLPNRVGNDITTHPITGFEEVVKLNDVQIPDSAFSTTKGIQTTWKYQLETTIARHDLPYTVDSGTLTLLDVTANNQQYSGSFLNFLVTAFRAVDAIPTLDDGVIGHNLLNERNNDITTEVQTLLDNDTVESRRYESNINDYASSVYSKIKNGSYEEIEDIGSTWFPSKNGYVTVRGGEAKKYADVDAKIKFNGSLRRISESYMQVKIYPSSRISQGTFGSTGDVPSEGTTGYYYTCDTDGYYSAVANETFNSGEVDMYVYNGYYKYVNDTVLLTPITVDGNISQWVTSEERWNQLEIETDIAILYNGNYSNNTFYIKDGGNELNNIGTEYKLSAVSSFTGYQYVHRSFEVINNVVISSPSTGDIRETKWRFKTIPARDFDTDIERQTSDRVKIKSVKTNQQQEGS